MIGKRGLWVLLMLPALSAFGAPAFSGSESGALEAVRHITLEASAPKDGQTVSADVAEIRLFFSGAPLLRGASVRVVTSSRSLVRSSPPAADPDDPKQLFVRLEQALAPGSYVIQWRCIADDGHVMRGDFRFRVE